MSSYKPNLLKSIFHKARRFAAKNWVKFFSPKIIGITGSQGKTSVRTIISHLFPGSVVTDLNLDTLYNVPITALKFRKKGQVGVFELGVDKINEMDLHLEIVKPKVSIITGISPVHSDKELLGSVENIIKEKRKLIEVLGKEDFAILNFDDENVRNMKSYTKANVLFYGTDPKTCAVYAKTKTGKTAKSPKEIDAEVSVFGTKFSIFCEGKEIKIETPLLGKHQVYNILASFLAYKTFHERILKTTKSVLEDEESLSFFVKKIAEIKPLYGRMSFEKVNGIDVLEDFLRSNPKSAEAGIELVSEIKTEGRKFLVLAEMGELGESAEKEHRRIGEIVAKSNAHFLISIGPLQKFTYEEAIKNGFPEKNAFYKENVIEAYEVLQENLKEGDLVYLKGSLLRHLERILLLLSGKKVRCNKVFCELYRRCSDCEFL